MAADLSGLSKKLNLCSDGSYEHFRDVLEDNAISENTPLETAEVKWFGDGCRLEGVSNTPVDVNRDQEFLSDVIGLSHQTKTPDPDSRQLVCWRHLPAGNHLRTI